MGAPALILASAALLATATGDPPVAVFRDGAITASDLASYVEARPLRARVDAETGRRRRLVELGVDTLLAARFDRERGGDDPERLRWRAVLERQLAARAAREAVTRPFRAAAPGSAPPTAPASGERRWRLANLFKRVPRDASPAERERIRDEVEALRREIEAGADFATLARTESDSTTAVRGGRLGTTTLESLRPELREAVAEMGPGDLSDVLETADGFTLLLCLGVVSPATPAPKPPDPGGLAWSRWASEARAAMTVTPVDPLPCAGEGRTVLARWSRGEAQGAWTVDDLRAELGLAAESPLPAACAPALERLAERQATWLRADAEGLLDEAYRRRVDWQDLGLRAELERRTLVAALERDPTEAELVALFASQKDRLRTVERVRLRALELDLEAASESLAERFVQVATAAPEPARSLAEWAEQLGPPVRLVELGWLDPSGLYDLGRSGEEAVGRLAPGGRSGLTQERRQLRVYELIEREASRPLSFDEARTTLAELWTRRERGRLRAEIDQRALTEAGWRVVE